MECDRDRPFFYRGEQLQSQLVEEAIAYAKTQMPSVDSIFDVNTAMLLKECASTHSVDPSHMFGLLISLASAMLGRGVTIKVPKADEDEFCTNGILWFLSLAYSGFGKTPATRCFTKALKMTEDLVNLRVHGFYRNGERVPARLWSARAQTELRRAKTDYVLARRTQARERGSEIQSMQVPPLEYVTFTNSAGMT